MDKSKHKVIRDCCEAAVVFLAIFILVITNSFSTIDYILRDRLYQIPRGVSGDIKIIAIDDKTIEAYGPVNTWSRSRYADLIRYLNADEVLKPDVIAFDILFSGNVDKGDSEFAIAAAESGNVVVDAHFIYDEKQATDADGVGYYPVVEASFPYEELSEVTRIGYSNISQDSDKIVRRVYYEDTYNGEHYNSLSREIFEMYREINNLPQPEIPRDKYGRTLINYSGKPGDYEAISFVDVVEGRIDSRAFNNSIVIVGAYANGMQDNFFVPNGGSKQMFGVEIHANIVQSFLQNRFSINGNPYIYGLILGLIGAIIHFLFKRSRLYVSAILLVAGIVGELLCGMYFNNKGITLSLIYLPFVLIIAFVYNLSVRYVLEKVRKRQVINAFKKYVAPQVVEEISKSGDFKVNLGGEERDIAVLFVDIRGFTTMSEILEPAEVVKILNDYLELTAKSVFDNSGTVDKFVGDAMMAVFNSPFYQEDYEYKAVCAAMAIVEGGRELAPKLMEKYGRSVSFGVGVNCGKAVIGNVGCDFRMDFTAIGDTVNTAARLEANAKAGQVLISEDLYERLKGRIEVTQVEPIVLKGKSNTFKIYQLDKLLG